MLLIPFLYFDLSLKEWLVLEPEAARQQIRLLGQDYDDGCGDGVSGFATSSLLWAFYCFLRSPTNLGVCLQLAIGAGGDTDSTAAMAGALCGAHLGYEAISKGECSCLVQLINDKGEWTVLQMRDMAASMFDKLSKRYQNDAVEKNL